MNPLLPVAVLAGAGYVAWRYLRGQAGRGVPRLPAPPTDELLTRRVLVSLRHAALVPDGFQVRVVGGTVMLSGAVGAAERDRVLRAVLAVPGIRGVRNELEARGAPVERAAPEAR